MKTKNRATIVLMIVQVSLLKIFASCCEMSEHIVRENAVVGNLQSTVDSLIVDQLTAMDVTAASAAIMDVKKGEVVAISNWQKSDDQVSPSYNRLLRDCYDPGSAFSIVSYASMLEVGAITSKSIIDARNPVFIYHGKVIQDAYPGGVMTAEDAIDRACNTAIVKLVTREYEFHPQDFLDAIDRLGWNDVPNMVIVDDTIRRTETRAVNDDYWSRISLAQMAYGYESRCSPMNLLVFYNAIANGGIRPDRGHICSEETAKQVQHALVMAVEKGVATSGVQSDEVKIAGMIGFA